MMAAARAFVDTNIFLRHLLEDNAAQSPAARSLLFSMEAGERSGWTTVAVVSEVVFVLAGRRLGLGRVHIRDAVVPLLSLPGLSFEHAPVLRTAFDLFVEPGIGFVDAYHAALLESRGETELYSFDRDFDRLPGLRRLEPQVAVGG